MYLCQLQGHTNIEGLLYSLAHMKASNLKAGPTDVAKTSLSQTWHITRGIKKPFVCFISLTINGLQ